ncbi:MAG TPA: nucleotidyltransferase domain-containing protein [Anaerolineae bacterium]
MSKLPDHLMLYEKSAINACAAALSETLSDNLMGLWLFGSKSRGDFQPDSDIDLLIVVRHLESEIRWQIRVIAADCSLQYDVLFNTHILDKARWDELVRYQDTLWREIQRDGIALLEALPVEISS